ncbi:phage portal protein [Clostridium kluyveri]|uniref:Phage-related protein n=2 Tax=Clostridium kluyveri TaxID=1534 RepID=A5N5F4_CLOK5|nr:phage portal protein [Clostridium kluyveri]EDK32535.1 Phage-related protein [Clostridium kluyveri DSM 555]BAH05475.1 hypothetical protein CKR_0424 [Clostridium kluyveri NBRC 12016]
MDIKEYINCNYNGSKTWFCEEVKQSYNLSRISKIVCNKNYLAGKHKILGKPDMQFKGGEYKTKKLIIQKAKTILNFHSTYLLGKPLSLTGSENKVKEYQIIYRGADYNEIDFDIIDNIGKYGDAYEYVYLDENKNICSKLIDSADAYPVYNNSNEYIAFIEHWTSTYKNIDSNVEYFTIYYTDRVEQWNNESGNLIMVSSSNNLSGLPIHYHNKNDIDPNFGVSLLEDIKFILDEVEDLLSKLGDAIYTLSINPIPVTIGQELLEKTINADVVGYAISLEDGADMKYINATMDYNTIKIYLDKLEQELNRLKEEDANDSGSKDDNVQVNRNNLDGKIVN